MQSKNVPKPYCLNPQNIKAFVLGCDPTAFDKLGNRLLFEYVFDLGRDQRYFSSILKNLGKIELSLQDIYVQNLITSYQETETSKNKYWLVEARKYILERKKEFDNIDPEKNIPALLTSECLYKVLMEEGVEARKAGMFYELQVQIPIPPNLNLLKRPLIPFYRHRNYLLGKWPVYSETLKALFR